MALKYLLVLSSLGLSVAFFDLFKSATPAVHTQDNNVVRGVPDYLHSKYLQETFVCDGGHTKISKSNINDNYCDCADKSDEPGTSACGALNSFHCINKGFKMVLLPGSRVDDHICDCCDGSDEAFGICANTCDAAAAKERAALEGATTAYRLGSALRANLIQAVIKEKNELADKLPAIAAEGERTRGLISSVKTSIDWAKIKANEAKETALSSASQMIDGLLNSKEFNARAFSNLLSKVVSTSNLSQGDISALVGGSSASSASGSAAHVDVTEEDHHHHDDDDLHHHHHHDDDHYQDGYGDDTAGHGHDHGHSHLHEEPVAPAAVDETATPRCDIVNHSGDERLLPVCRSEDPLAAGHQLLASLLKDTSRHAAYMLLTGHFKLHNSFDAAEEFVAGQLEAAKQGTCPAAFDSIREHCSLVFKLTEAFENYNQINDSHDDGEDLKKLRQELGELEDKLRSQDSEKRNAEQAGKDLIEHKEQLELLALKDQCFDVVDGKFSYSLCVLGRISQKENEGHNTVTLGEYSSKENNSKDASITLHYTNGQHCHAHGARKADVKVVCGPAHALKSASEPSTCFYDLLFESPIACTPQFAALNGIVA